MPNFKEMTYDELQALRREKMDALGEIYNRAQNRKLNEEEASNEYNLSREITMIKEEIELRQADSDHQKAVADQMKEAHNQQFREFLKSARTSSKMEREILLLPGTNSDGTSNTKGNVDASGAIRLTIHEMIPTLHEGLGLPYGLNIISGVEGNEVWPVSVNDVEMNEVGEVEALSDQVLNFEKITPTVRRCGLTVPVSNMAIDNAAFDLMAFVQAKFGIAFREYWAKKIYSRALWTGNKGPFSGMAASGVITIGSDTYKQILEAVAEFSNKGFFEGEVCLSMDRVTEAQLMSTPKIAGAAGGFCIENGRCCGYRYTTSHFVNTEFDEDSKLIAGKGRYLLIGYWEWFAGQQHGDVRLSIDATSREVAKRNITAVTINTAFSMTDLSVYINGANNATQAFGCYAVMGTTPDVLIGQHAVSVGKSSTYTLKAVNNSGATVTWSLSAGTATGTTINSSTGVVSTGSTAGTATATASITVGGVTYTDTCKVVVA